MTTIKIVTDSTAELTQDVFEQLGITVVPLTIHVDGQDYLDGVTLSAEEFISKMKQSKELPKSSQPSAGTFTEIYDELGKDGSEILSIHMTGGMSGTVKSAESAASITSSNVTVVDSRFISHALAFQVKEAARLAQQGKSMGEILRHLDRVRENTRLFVVVDTLDNLVKGGRIGKGRAMLGSLLSIKPIASLAGGEYTPVAKARSYKQVITYLMNEFTKDSAAKRVKAVGIAQADGYQMATPLKEAIEATGFKDVKLSFTTPVISTHTGPGAIGFMYLLEG
ncbi:DegV family protein [Chryseomicrobium aureum]|uniref:DegV family protein n=1 Tax=Chryseomicrobium aureum TaxID=1441723 RepID=UPI00195DA7EE|nr:DegV family protein [Chryseomicrobium aureum]MBM7705608.1 DegV family protein with EDD domain [Chryseomicrobium aureum]